MACYHIKGVTCSECEVILGGIERLNWNSPIIERTTISRRDLFLAAALCGVMQRNHGIDQHQAAKIAVAFADSLLKEIGDGE